MSPRLECLLKESHDLFPQPEQFAENLDTLLAHVPLADKNAAANGWVERYYNPIAEYVKQSFVDAATAQMGGMPPMDPAMMDPAMAGGGAPPMDPAMAAMGAPPDAGLAGGAMPPPTDPASAGLPGGPGAAGGIDPMTGQPVPPKIKVDTNAIMLQVLRLLALMADHLKIPVPASLMTVMPQELMSLPQQPPSKPSGGGEGAAPPSAIPPIEPIEPIQAAAPGGGGEKMSAVDLVGLADAIRLKNNW